MTLLLVMNLGFAWGASGAGASPIRRGRRARGRAHYYGRHLWWLIALVQWAHAVL